MTVKPNQHWATCENTASRWSCRKSISRSETKSSKVAVFTRLFRFMPSKIIIKVQHSHLGHVSWSGSWCCIKGGVNMPFSSQMCSFCLDLGQQDLQSKLVRGDLLIVDKGRLPFAFSHLLGAMKPFSTVSFPSTAHLCLVTCQANPIWIWHFQRLDLLLVYVDWGSTLEFGVAVCSKAFPSHPEKLWC